MSGVFGGGSDMPKIKAARPSVTAAALPQMTEQEKRNKALAASMMTKDWMDASKLKLGKPGLLGL